jgi:hypothetical protein
MNMHLLLPPSMRPFGRRFGIYEREDIGAYEIVGVVRNATYTHPHEDAKAMVFEPLAQWQHRLKDPIFVYLEAQTHNRRGTQQNLEQAVRFTLAEIDPNLAIISLRSLDSQLAGNFNPGTAGCPLDLAFRPSGPCPHICWALRRHRLPNDTAHA